jgi:hypothetical protein
MDNYRKIVVSFIAVLFEFGATKIGIYFFESALCDVKIIDFTLPGE